MAAAPPPGELGDDEKATASFIEGAGATQMRRGAAGIAHFGRSSRSASASSVTRRTCGNRPYTIRLRDAPGKLGAFQSPDDLGGWRRNGRAEGGERAKMPAAYLLAALLPRAAGS